MTSDDTSPGNGQESSGPEIQLDEDAPDWEHIARQQLRIYLESELADDIEPYAYKVVNAIENDEDPVSDLFEMAIRFHVFSGQVITQLVKTGDLEYGTPQVGLFQRGSHLHGDLLRLGEEIESEEIDTEEMKKHIDTARDGIERIQETLAEVESEYGLTSDESDSTESGAAEGKFEGGGEL